MEKTEISQNNDLATHEVGLRELNQSLPTERSLFGDALYFYQGFWCPSKALKPVISFQNHFQGRDNDIIIVTTPKSGTTWMKALIFAIVNRDRFEFKDSPLLSSNPHTIVPFFEFDVYLRENPSLYLENNLSNPRIFSTHIPYASLPSSIKNSTCKIVYVCRNPLDVFISYWHFTSKLLPEYMKQVSLHEAFKMFCQGIHSFGPFFDHVLGFWEAVNKKDAVNRILFLKYEDLKEDIFSQIKELAKFLGFPFSKEEEEQGVVEEVVKLCSFENLKDLEVNKTGKLQAGLLNTHFFRKGVVGDWSNYLTPTMIEYLENLIHQKLDNTGLTFKIQADQ